MALNIKTDSEFDEALAWLASQEGKSKSEIVRGLVIYWYGMKRKGFEFGALKKTVKEPIDSEMIMRELKQLDRDHDLD